jgi:hypothetical protein
LNRKLEAEAKSRDAENAALPPSVAELKLPLQTIVERNDGNMKKVLLALALLIPTISFAQTYTIDWYKIAGGGGTSTGGTYQVSGTIGQPEAGGAMTGGTYSLTGGFWTINAVQTPGAPVLTITHAGNQAIVSWDASVTGWTLQTNVNLATPTWGNYLGSIVNNRVTNSPANGNLFFRLTQ